MRFITGISAAAIALISVPALAETKPGTPAPVTESGTKAAKDTQYCVIETLTGSRIPQKICKTRAAWLALDFDPLAPKK